MASAGWQGVRTARAAWPGCSTSWTCSAKTEPVWSTAAIIEALETSRSTGYRYIKTLHDAGLLTAVRNGYYSLGPRIIEMDLPIRQTDPLLLASHGVLEELVDKIGHSALLCTAYGDSVLCIGEPRAP